MAGLVCCYDRLLTRKDTARNICENNALERKTGVRDNTMRELRIQIGKNTGDENKDGDERLR